MPGGTSNVAAAMRYGLRPVGTMAHSYVMSFEHEQEAFVAFMEDTPHNTVMLVDTYDTLAGVRHAIEAARTVGVPLRGVRIDSGDLLDALAGSARRVLDEAGMRETPIIASGDLDEDRIAQLVAAGAPIDRWGVGTDLGTSRDAPAVGGVYKLVADQAEHGTLARHASRRSPGKATLPGPKQVFRRYEDGADAGRRDRLGGRAAARGSRCSCPRCARAARRAASRSTMIARPRRWQSSRRCRPRCATSAERPAAPSPTP